MPRINEETFKSVAVPLPPINIQNAMVDYLNIQTEQIKDLKKQADDLRKEALEEFEKEIFE
jgi:restriction endonuclease S subunit